MKKYIAMIALAMAVATQASALTLNALCTDNTSVLNWSVTNNDDQDTAVDWVRNNPPIEQGSLTAVAHQDTAFSTGNDFAGPGGRQDTVSILWTLPDGSQGIVGKPGNISTCTGGSPAPTQAQVTQQTQPAQVQPVVTPDTTTQVNAAIDAASTTADITDPQLLALYTRIIDLLKQIIAILAAQK